MAMIGSGAPFVAITASQLAAIRSGTVSAMVRRASTTRAGIRHLDVSSYPAEAEVPWFQRLDACGKSGRKRVDAHSTGNTAIGGSAAQEHAQ
jgi:hypothetical protein